MLTRLRHPSRRLHPVPINLIPQCLVKPPPSCPVRLFTSTRSHSDNPGNHYEVLRLPPDCTKAELKQQFYALSKEHHPDINRRDPDAAKKFAQISESYSVLADPEKRKRYDRDHMRTRERSPRATRSGSYAGSRPASGLSKRRSAFRGPPPSFYAHGNPSANTAKQAASSTAQSSSPDPSKDAPGGTFNANAYSEFAADFDANSTFKTQSHEDMRRHGRRAAAMAAAQEEASDSRDFWVRFVVVAGVVMLGVTVGTLVTSLNNPKGGLTRADGSRRSSNARNEWAKG